MMNEELINQYRGQFLKALAATVTIVSCVEIVAYFIFVLVGVHPFSFTSSYLWINVVMPICINTIIYMVARKICRSKGVGYRAKNHTVSYAAIAVSFIVSLFHRDYLVTSCAFVFPIILSAMYNDRTILKRSLFVSLLFLSITVLVLFLEDKLNLTTSLNVMVLYGFIAVSYLSGNISIKFSHSNFSLIEKQALDNSRLEVEIDLDQMTQLYNHEAFYEKLGMVIDNSKNGQENCYLAMIDIDDFKAVNDTYGHNAGDDVLIALAEILKNFCDKGDFACRYGGEEFALILCGKSFAEAENVVNTALQHFSETRFAFTKKSLTFSAGLIRLKTEDTTNSAFKRADHYLYISKHSGKNRVTAASGETK